MNRYWYIFKDRAHAGRFLCGLAIFALCVLGKIELWQPAFGENVMGYTDFSCNAGQATGNLFDTNMMGRTVTFDNNSGGTATFAAPAPVYNHGYLEITDPTAGSGACSDNTQPNLGIFARLLCFFQYTLGQIMSTMYCGFQQVLRGPILGAMTLFVVVYGIYVVTGMAEVNLRQVMKTILKMVLVLLFATHASWGIGVGYHFFMAMAEGGAGLVLWAMNNAMGGTASLTQPDALLYSVFDMVSTGNGFGHTAAAAGNLLQGLHISSYCATLLAPLLLMLLLAIPPIAIFLIIMIILYIGLYARAVLGYLTALILITFLFVLSPIFLCFALFSATYKIFERWLQYLISYSLQMIIVFAFLAMLQLVPVGSFMTNTLALLKEYDMTVRFFKIEIPIHTCGICDLGTIDNNKSLLTAYVPPNSPNPPTGATPPACVPWQVPTINPLSPFQPINLYPGDVLSVPDDQNGANPGRVYPVIPLLNLLQHQDFVEYMLAQIIALWLIGYVMEDFLKKAPDIAKEIGSMPLALTLGGGGQPQVIGDNMVSMNYAGMESIEAGFQGFKRALTKDPMNVEAWPRRISGALTGSIDSFLHGDVDSDNPDAVELQKQSQEIAGYVADRQQTYVRAQQITNANYDALLRQQPSDGAKKAFQDYEALVNRPDTSKADLAAAYKELNPTQRKLADYEQMKADPNTKQADLDKFKQNNLELTQQSYATAKENETAIRQDLDDASQQQSQINQQLEPMMLAGIVDTRTADGISRGPSSLMRNYATNVDTDDDSSGDGGSSLDGSGENKTRNFGRPIAQPKDEGEKE